MRTLWGDVEDTPISPPVGSTSIGWTWAEAIHNCADPVFEEAADGTTRRWKESRANRTVADPVRKALAERTLVGYGRYGSAMAPSQAIPPTVWQVLKVVNATKSIFEERTPAATRIFDVRVFPVLRSPDATEFVAGKSLADAFKEFVLGDPEVVARAKYALAAEPDYAPLFQEGRCYPRGQKQWCMTWPEAYLEALNDPTEMWVLISPISPAVLPAERALMDRVAALIGLLRGGRLRATGLPVQANAPLAVPPALWAHEDFYFDARTGDFLEHNREAVDPPYDGLLKRWSGLMLEKPMALAPAEAGPMELPHLRTSVTGRRIKPTAVRAGLNARQECEDWLAAEMAMSPNHKADPKRHWRDKALKRWSGTLSKRAFDAAWSSAIVRTNAEAWRSAGAPRGARKSQRGKSAH